MSVQRQMEEKSSVFLVGDFNQMKYLKPIFCRNHTSAAASREPSVTDRGNRRTKQSSKKLFLDI